MRGVAEEHLIGVQADPAHTQTARDIASQGKRCPLGDDHPQAHGDAEAGRVWLHPRPRRCFGETKACAEGDKHQRGGDGGGGPGPDGRPCHRRSGRFQLGSGRIELGVEQGAGLRGHDQRQKRARSRMIGSGTPNSHSRIPLPMIGFHPAKLLQGNNRRSRSLFRASRGPAICGPLAGCAQRAEMPLARRRGAESAVIVFAAQTEMPDIEHLPGRGPARLPVRPGASRGIARGCHPHFRQRLADRLDGIGLPDPPRAVILQKGGLVQFAR